MHTCQNVKQLIVARNYMKRYTWIWKIFRKHYRINISREQASVESKHQLVMLIKSISKFLLPIMLKEGQCPNKFLWR